MKAFEHYNLAGDDLDDDEGYHARTSYNVHSWQAFMFVDDTSVDFLALAIECMWRSKAPLEVIFIVSERIRRSVPKMRKIWASSQMNASRDVRIQQVLEFETEYTGRIERGEATLADVVVPKVSLYHTVTFSHPLSHARRTGPLRAILKCLYDPCNTTRRDPPVCDILCMNTMLQDP